MGESIKSAVSFPVTIWYSPETGHIHLTRPTDPTFVTSVSPDTNSALSHPHLYRQLARALRDGGALSPDERHS